MIDTQSKPESDECELILLGSGYGESLVLHIGGGNWIIVDSCVASDGTPRALRYLQGIGVDPSQSVVLIVVTHWHDDHIRGIARLLEVCPEAKFCCSSALCHDEFLTTVGTVKGRYSSNRGSGIEEIHRVFSQLTKVGKQPIRAIKDRIVFRDGNIKVHSLSPSDQTYQQFLQSTSKLVPTKGFHKARIRDLSPNDTSVVLWVTAGKCTLLLGADMEKQRWAAVLDSQSISNSRASVFKVPHHGSVNADEPEVWAQLLEKEPIAILTPWKRGDKALPTEIDIKRILERTPNAWITGNVASGHAVSRHPNDVVNKSLREGGVQLQNLTRGDDDFIRLRRSFDSDDPWAWAVETSGVAHRLEDAAA